MLRTTPTHSCPHALLQTKVKRGRKGTVIRWKQLRSNWDQSWAMIGELLTFVLFISFKCSVEKAREIKRHLKSHWARKGWCSVCWCVAVSVAVFFAVLLREIKRDQERSRLTQKRRRNSYIHAVTHYFALMQTKVKPYLFSSLMHSRGLSTWQRYTQQQQQHNTTQNNTATQQHSNTATNALERKPSYKSPMHYCTNIERC